MTAPQGAILSARETVKLRLLGTIAAANQAGARPSKADLSRGLASKTRAGRYQQLDQMIRRGLLVNLSETVAAYALVVTPAGLAEIDRWEQA